MFTANLLLHCLLSALVCALLSGIAFFWISTVFPPQGSGSDAALARAFGMVMIPVAGALVGLILGGVGTLLLAKPTFWKILGIAAGLTVVAGIATLTIFWKNSDYEPRIEGKLLDVEIELKLAPGSPAPDPVNDNPRMVVYGGELHAGNFALDLTNLQAKDGTWIIHDFFPLNTRRADRSLDIEWKQGTQVYFEIHGEPAKSAFQWSPWIQAKNASGFQLRYKLRFRGEAVKTEPDQNTRKARAIAALSPEAPIEEWIQFLSYDLPQEPRTQISGVLEKRQAELVAMILSNNTTRREQAVMAVSYLNASSAELNQAILREGKAIVEALKRLEALPETDPGFDTTASELNSRFDDWRRAWWAIQYRIPDFDDSLLREIHQLSQSARLSSALRDIELNARVMLDALKKDRTIARQ